MVRNMFSVFETELLLELIKKRISIVDSKETNKVSLAKKSEAFEEIAKEFNASLNVVPRTANQLRQRYNNLRKGASRTCAEVRKEVRKTGGGVISSKNINEIEERVLEMGVLTTPLRTQYDSDASYLDFLPSQDTQPTAENYNQIHPVEDFGVNSQEIEDYMPEDLSNSATVDEETPTTSSHLPTPSNSVPSRRPRALELFRRKAKSKAPTVSASFKAAQALIEESKNRVENERKKAEREQIEHDLRMELIKKEIDLKQKKIDVQEKILHILDSNPGSITLNFK